MDGLKDSLFRRYGEAILVSALLVLHTALLVHGSFAHSPTIDEVAHLPSGINHWLTGRFDLYRVNPPLIRMAASAPVLAMHPRLDWGSYDDRPHSRSEFFVGRDFINANGARSFVLFSVARCACIPFSLIGGIVCWRWARDLGGCWSGGFAIVLWCLCPSVVAHGHLITPDVGAAALGVLAMYAMRRWSQTPDWAGVWMAGLALGFAELAKTSLLVLYVMLPLAALLSGGADSICKTRLPRYKKLIQAGGIALLSLYVVNLGYGFEGSCRRLDDFTFISKLAQTIVGESSSDNTVRSSFQEVLVKLPIPLPANYIMGIDVQRWDFEQGVWSYLGGKWRHGGWWYYYLYAFGVKTPAGTLLLLFASVVRLGFFPLFGNWRDTTREYAMLLIPAAAILGLVSSQTGINQHWRYAIPALPYVIIFTSLVVAETSNHRHGMARWQWMIRCVCVAALVWSAASTVRCLPHSLSYFNEIAGGPSNGHRHLLGSNFDWGQDLLFLKKWHDANPTAKPLFVSYTLRLVDPRVAGIDCQQIREPYHGGVADQRIRPGWYVVSINDLLNPRNEVSFLQNEVPIDKIGYTMLVFHVPPP